MFSRNASSSRAIPVAKLLDQVRNSPAAPVYWGKNQTGMQAREELEGAELQGAKDVWLEAAQSASVFAEKMMNLGVHKQVANRLLEPFTYINVVVTATEWDNWYELRDHEDAQPEIRDLAMTMRRAINDATPRLLTQRHLKDPRDWHLPYVTMEEREHYEVSDLLAMSAARCARVSYLTHNKENPKIEDDLALYKRLVESKPLHASPLEHQACVSRSDHRSQNFMGGWIQHRFLLETAGSIEELRKYVASE
jgi:thymidylate synthase ThyX